MGVVISLSDMSLSPASTAKDLFLDSCHSNSMNKVRHLLSQGANVNWKRDSNGCLGLHIAAARDYRELLELLLCQTGVDVNTTSYRDMTPLMWACSQDHENVVRRLCQVRGIDLNIKDDIGRTALHWAVFQNNSRRVEVLTEVHGVLDWNITTNAGHNPLKRAVEFGYADILQTLLSVPHLDVSVIDGRGRIVAQIAVEEERGERQRCVEILSRDRRVDWNMKNSAGDTPVMFCLKTNKIEMARCLINTPGVDLDTMDRDGKYLETIARERNQREILSMIRGLNGNSIQERIPECPVRMIREKIELVSITLSRSVSRGSEASPGSTSVGGVTSCVGTVGLELR